MTAPAIHVWEGIFEDFPAEDPEGVFDSEQWIEAIAGPARAGLTALATEAPPAAPSLVHEYPLAVLAAVACGARRAPLRILDFGGGLGASYLALAASLPDAGAVHCCILETPAVCARGRTLYHAHPNVEFVDAFPDPVARPQDIVHAGSAFQYVRDWRGTLSRFVAYGARHLCFGNLLAGAVPTFVTRQNYYGRRIPVRFFNLGEFAGALQELGYVLISHTRMNKVILGRSGPLPMDNLPPEYRLSHGCNLIFERAAD